MPSSKYSDHMLIRQIAVRAGLTVSSVYKILNGDSGFSSTTRQRVEALAEQMQVRLPRLPNSRSLTIGVLLPEHPAYFWNEAIRSIKCTAQAVQAQRGIKLEMVFRFLHFPLEETEVEAALRGLSESACQALILYPIDCPAFRTFVATRPPAVPIVLFNELPEDARLTQELRSRPLTAYIGADHDDEGRCAARILGERLRGMHHILALLSADSRTAAAAHHRIAGFIRTATEYRSDLDIQTEPLDTDGRLTPGFLAARIEPDILSGRLDCLYVTSGVTHLASAAIAKVRRRNCLPPSVCPLCLGQECAPSDRPYLLDGTQCGYVKQDVYTQARIAIEQVTEALLDGAPLSDVLVRSSVFVNGGPE